MRHSIKKNFIFFMLISFSISTVYFLPHHRTSPKIETPLPASITVFRESKGIAETIPFESYVAGVLASEMPSTFEVEAQKAQAIAARTYAYGKCLEADEKGNPSKHPSAPICDTTHCQVYQDQMDLTKQKGIQWMEENWEDTKNIVKHTAGQVLYFDGRPIRYALFHASSGGTTENCEDVFASAVPYLKSVDSPYEDSTERRGHGVGMSQHGANGMAKAGYTYKEILAHYYTGTTVY